MQNSYNFIWAKAVYLLLCCCMGAQLMYAQKPTEKRPFEVNSTITENPWKIENNVRYDLKTGLPVAIYTPDYRALGNTPEEKAMDYIRSHHEFLGLTKQEIMELKHHATRNGLATTVVRYRQQYKKLPVNKAELTITLDKNGSVLFVMNSFVAKVQLNSTTPLITVGGARAKAIAQIDAKGTFDVDKSELMVYSHDGQNRLAYRINIIPESPYGDWEVIVDALNGNILRAADIAAYHKEHANHNNDNDPCKGTAMMASGVGNVFDPEPLSSARATYGATGYTDNSDANSTQLLAQQKSVTLLDITYSSSLYSLRGPYASIYDTEAPNNGLFSQASSTFAFNRVDAGFEAVNTYYHVDKSMRYINTTLGITLMPYQYTLGVRYDPHGLNGDDNSHYTGSNGQIAFGEGCVDDAEDADVVLHELGHGLHDWVTSGGLSQVNGLSEGCGDYWASSYSRSKGYWEPSESPYYWMFHWDGHNTCWSGRVTNYAAVYPSGLTGSIHTDGQIWATCLMGIWDDIGRRATDIAFLEGLGMTGGTTNQNDAAVAVYNAAQSLGYTTTQLSAMATRMTARGYTLPTKYVKFLSANAVASEGSNCATRTVSIPVHIVGAPASSVNVTIGVGGTTNAGDYSVSPTTLVFTTTNWATDQYVNITINQDAIIEPNEYLILSLSASGGASVGSPSTYTYAIVNDDSEPSATGNITLLNETFDNLVNWTVTNGGSAPDTWALSTGYGGVSANSINGSTFLFADSDPAGDGSDMNEVIVSPTMNAAGVSNLTLQFDQYFRNYNGGYNEQCYADVWNGSTWVNVYTRSGNLQTGLGAWSAPDHQTIDISAYANSALKVRFRFDAQWDWWWALDNITITGVAPTNIQTAINSTAPAQQTLGGYQTAYFYDPTSSKIMCKIENLTAFNYGCVSVEVDNSGTGAQAIAGYTLDNQLFMNKTYKITPQYNNPNGAYNVTFYIDNTEKTGWENMYRSWEMCNIIKTTGPITALSPGMPFESAYAAKATFGSHHTISANFYTGFSGFGFSQLTGCTTPTNPREPQVSANGITIAWDAVPNAARYEIWGKRGAVNTRTFYTTATSKTFGSAQIAPNKTYQWKVRAQCADSTWSEYTEVRTVITPAARNGAPVTSDMFGSFDTPDFNLQPNPARHTLTLALNNLVDQATITITDITGKVVSQQNVANTDLINLPVQYLQSGMYFLTLTVQDAHTTQKFIKN